MDVRVSRVFVVAAVFGIGIVGFLLSVFAIIITLVIPVRQPLPVIIPPLPGLSKRRGHRTFSANELSQSSTVSPPPSPSNTMDNILHGHELASSLIYGEPQTTHFQRVEHAQDIIRSKREYGSNTPTFLEDKLYTSPYPTHSTESDHSSKHLISERVMIHPTESRPGLKLCNLKSPWKENRPMIYRYASSPHLRSKPAPWSSPPNDQPMSSIAAKKTSKSFLKVSNNPTSISRGLRSASVPALRKKESQILRTQPYEAPYFSPLPTPRSRSLGRDNTRQQKTRRGRAPQRRKIPPSQSIPPVPALPTAVERPLVVVSDI